MDPWLPNDYARCNGVKVDGEWRKDCEDCLRRTAPIKGQTWATMMQPKPGPAFQCDMRIRP